jgi:hypothetical protein
MAQVLVAVVPRLQLQRRQQQRQQLGRLRHSPQQQLASAGRARLGRVVPSLAAQALHQAVQSPQALLPQTPAVAWTTPRTPPLLVLLGRSGLEVARSKQQ